MPTKIVDPPDKFHFEVPPFLMKQFQESPRFVIKPAPGIWPVPIDWFRRPEFWKELAANKEFQEKFEVYIMPR